MKVYFGHSVLQNIRNIIVKEKNINTSSILGILTQLRLKLKHTPTHLQQIKTKSASFQNH